MPFGPYDAGGTRTVEPTRDVHEAISRIDPEKTPLLSAMSIQSGHDTMYEALTDSLAAVDPTNAQAIGADAPAAVDTTRVLVYNYMQIFAKTASVSDTQQNVRQFGLDNEFNYQKAKKIAEMKRDIESRLVSDGDRQAPTPANAGIGLFRAIARTITTNVDAAGVFSQALFDTLMQTITTAGGEPGDVYCDGTRKMAITDFTATDRRAFQDPRSVVNMVDVYQSDFGQVRTHFHWLQPTTIAVAAQDPECLILTMSLLEMRELQTLHWFDLARTGTARRAEGVWQLTFMNRNELGHGMFRNL